MGSFFKAIFAVAGIATLVVVAARCNLQHHFLDVLGWIAGFGAAGSLIYVALYMVTCLALIPGTFLTLGAGVIFGLLSGSINASIGATLGATGAFLIGRYVARDWVEKRIAGRERFRSVDAAVARQGWIIVFLSRLSPFFPFVLINYAFGLTNVPLKHYIAATWLGILPSTVMYVYLGSLAGDLASLGADERVHTQAAWALYGVGLLATVAVTVVVTRLARRSLGQRMPNQDPC